MRTHEWETQGHYSQGWESVSTDSTLEEARETVRAYRENERGVPFRIRLVPTDQERTLRRLLREAREAARMRGHEIKRAKVERSESRSTAVLVCRRCGSEVGVDTRPLPNGIEIGGEAVAVGCQQ